MMRLTIVLAVLLLGFATRPGISPAGGWDREAAARYLDERMDVWFTKAKKLRTGQGERPFRPALAGLAVFFMAVTRQAPPVPGPPSAPGR